MSVPAIRIAVRSGDTSPSARAAMVRKPPHILITTSLNDSRVHYWEPAKWAARLRDRKTDNNMLLLKTNMGAGHGGASGRYDRYKELSLEYAFIVDRVGVPSSAVSVD